MAHILLIDDDDAVRDVVRTLLCHHGHTVVEARDGDEGLRLYPSVKADLLITDIMMPKKNGLEVLTALRDSRSPFKAIAISGGSLPGHENGLERALALGAAKVLAKPFTRDALINAVNDLLFPGCSDSRAPAP